MLNKVLIIAEVGVNHNGRLDLALKLVDAAKDAGADAVKFQTFHTEDLATYSAPLADYQKKGTSSNSQFEMLKKLELSQNNFRELFDYCKKRKITFMSTPFDLKSADFLNKLGVSIFKIPSGEITNIPLLEKIASFKKPVIMSTGMATLKEVREAVDAIFAAGNKKLMLLHCTSNYPASFKDVNLRAIETLRKEFRLRVGYSDHTPGIEVSVAAVALGATVIEKHLTLDQKLKGPDHASSLVPGEFENLVASIRNIELSLGDGIKKPGLSEMEVMKAVRKSIVAKREIPNGTHISAEMLVCKRPGNGISPKHFNTVIAMKAKVDIRQDAVLKWEMLTK